MSLKRNVKHSRGNLQLELKLVDDGTEEEEQSDISGGES